MSTEAAIAKGKGIIANPEFFITFLLAGLFGVAGTLTIGVSNVWGWALIGIAAVLTVVVAFVEKTTGLHKTLWMMGLAVVALGAGLLSTSVVSMLWFTAEADGGHGSPLIAGVLGLLMIALPVASIAGEKILPLFVASIAAIWGILSIIVVVLVIVGVD